MQLETFEEADGRRVRLNKHEREQLLDMYSKDPRRRIGLALMARCGCRCQEAVDVRPIDVFRDDETGRRFLRIPEGKGKKEREVPIPEGLASRIETFSANRCDPTDSVIDVTTRTLRRWTVRAADQLRAETGDDRWRHVRPHDLRRTWGHLTLEAEVLPSVVMQWGGWEDYDTFQKHYLGKHSLRVQDREAEKVDWL